MDDIVGGQHEGEAISLHFRQWRGILCFAGRRSLPRGRDDSGGTVEMTAEAGRDVSGGPVEMTAGPGRDDQGEIETGWHQQKKSPS